MSTSTIKDAKAQIAHLQAALEQETEARLQLDRRLRQAHAEFQQVARGLSHDLREAFRTVDAYCELVARETRHESETGSAGFRQHVLRAVERTQNLVAGIIEYAAADAEGRELADVNLNRAFDDTARSVLETFADISPKLTRDPLPTVRGDVDKLSRALRHLLDNAIKFSSRADPEGHFAARRDGGEWIFCLRDNGPGIEQVYADRVFELFKRLHGKEVPGSGIGLAYCKKVIAFHGGRIWLESSPGQGSAFYFTLPASD